MKRGHLYKDVFGKGFITMEKAVQTSQGTDQELSSVQFLTITAVFVALTYIFTAFINVKLPIAANGGLIHLGNVPLFIGAIFIWKENRSHRRRNRNGLVRPSLRLDPLGTIYPYHRRHHGIHRR